MPSEPVSTDELAEAEAELTRQQERVEALKARALWTTALDRLHSATAEGPDELLALVERAWESRRGAHMGMGSLATRITSIQDLGQFPGDAWR